MNPKVVLITGAGSGIGRGIAESLAAEGMTVVITDLDEATALETASLIKQKGVQR